MNVPCNVMTVIALCAGCISALVAQNPQPVRAYKSNPTSWGKRWTLQIKSAARGSLISSAEFKKNTDSLGDPLMFRFEGDQDANIITVIKNNLLDSTQDDEVKALKLRVSKRDVPQGSQIKITDKKIVIEKPKSGK